MWLSVLVLQADTSRVKSVIAESFIRGEQGWHLLKGNRLVDINYIRF